MKSDFLDIVKSSYAFNQNSFDKDSRWNILEELYDRNFLNLVTKDYARLPKKIHQIWLGSEFPVRYKKFAESWKKFNPDWEYKLWTDNNINDVVLTNRIIYDSITNLGQKSDYLRYHILNQFGGIYVDTDFECLKSFDSLSYVDFLVGVGYPTQLELYIGLIASIPHHPIMELIVKSMPKIGRRNVKVLFNTTGSYFFTRKFFEIVNNYREGVVVLPTDYLYPFPNKPGHENKMGMKYIKDCSYAVHHWAVSWGKKHDWIQGERFMDLADYTYSPKVKECDDYDNLPNTVDWTKLENNIVIYTHIAYAKQLLDIMSAFDKKFVLITHSCDRSIDKGKIIKTINGKVVGVSNYLLPDNLVKWFSKNVNVIDPRIESIPIGLENSRWYASVKKMDKMLSKLGEPRKIKNQVYLNVNVSTNPLKRSMLYPLFKGKPWVTIEEGRNGQNFIKYLDNIYNHNFVICPEGNGIDTHRTWETLYMGSIPIEKRNINNQFYTDLPICFVDQWEEVTESFLIKEYTRIKEGVWNMEKLGFDYWKDKIHSNI